MVILVWPFPQLIKKDDETEDHFYVITCCQKRDNKEKDGPFLEFCAHNSLLEKIDH